MVRQPFILGGYFLSDEEHLDDQNRTLEVDRIVKLRLAELHLRSSELVRRWGYANMSKGLRRLEQLCAGWFVPDKRGTRALAAALEISIAKLETTFDVTRQQLEQAQRAATEREWKDWCSRFRPHAILKTERQTPSSIFLAAMIGVDRILRRNIDDDRPPVTWTRQVIAELPAIIPCFGQVTGLFMNYAPDWCVEYDVLGNPIRTFTKARRPGCAQIDVKSRDITRALQVAMGAMSGDKIK